MLADYCGVKKKNVVKPFGLKGANLLSLLHFVKIERKKT